MVTAAKLSTQLFHDIEALNKSDIVSEAIPFCGQWKRIVHVQVHSDKQALLKVCGSISNANTMITHANPTAATNSSANFSRGEGRAVWRTGAVREAQNKRASS